MRCVLVIFLMIKVEREFVHEVINCVKVYLNSELRCYIYRGR